MPDMSQTIDVRKLKMGCRDDILWIKIERLMYLYGSPLYESGRNG